MTTSQAQVMNLSGAGLTSSGTSTPDTNPQFALPWNSSKQRAIFGPQDSQSLAISGLLPPVFVIQGLSSSLASTILSWLGVLITFQLR